MINFETKVGERNYLSKEVRKEGGNENLNTNTNTIDVFSSLQKLSKKTHRKLQTIITASRFRHLRRAET